MKTLAIHYFNDREVKVETDEKVWGTEHIICREPHAAKIMELKPGYQTSLHFHALKNETFILIQGEMIVETVTQKGHPFKVRLREPFSTITLSHNTPHTFYCPDGQLETTIFIEASTMDRKDDSYRVFPSRRR